MSKPLSAPIDVFYPDEGILIRQLRGVADLTKRSCSVEVFERDVDLTNYRATVANDQLPELTILKAKSRSGRSLDERDGGCAATFDVALGPDASFVILEMEGQWAARGPEAHLIDAAGQ